jgi:hypothetical protein
MESDLHEANVMARASRMEEEKLWLVRALKGGPWRRAA